MNMAPAVLELSEGERAGLLGWHAFFLSRNCMSSIYGKIYKII